MTESQLPEDYKTITDCPVLSVQNLAEDIYLMRLHGTEIAENATPGQFVNIRVGDNLVLLMRRPFSICRRSIEDGWFEVLWKVVGAGTQAMSRLHPGDVVSVIGPLGRGYQTSINLELALLVGGGIGVAALIFLGEELYQAGIVMEVFLGARNAKELVLTDFFQNLQIPLVVTTEDGSAGSRDLITTPLNTRLRNISQPDKTHLFSCGPPGFLAVMMNISQKTGIAGQVAIETKMACGFGICVGCAVRTNHPRVGDKKYKLVCIDGPVFDARAILLND